MSERPLNRRDCVPRRCDRRQHRFRDRPHRRATSGAPVRKIHSATPQRVDKATGFFKCHGGKVLTVARFVEGLRQANGIIAGISAMDWARFLAFNALGAAL